MAPSKRSRTSSKRKPRTASSTGTLKRRKKKKSVATTKSYTILKSARFDPTKKLSSQGKTRKTTRTGAHLASKVALAKRKRPTRIYLYRHKKIMTYAIRYETKDGKVRATAKIKKTKYVSKRSKSKKKTTKKKKKTTKKCGKTSCKCATKGACTRRKKRSKSARQTEIARLKRRLTTLTKPKRRTV